MRLAATAAVALTACQPYAPSLGGACLVSAPAAPIAGPVGCAAALPVGAEGRSVDALVASPGLRAIVREPAQSVTLPGVGGGTVVDLAPWGLPDAVHEIVPLFGGGALVPDSVVVGDDAIEVVGPVVAIPGEPAPTASRGAFAWRADGATLIAEGAEGLRVHLVGDVVDWGGRYQTGDTVLIPGGPVTDLGGALVVDGDRVVVAAAADVPAWWDGGTRPAAGTTTGARLAWRRGDEVVGRWSASEAFAVDVPDDWTHVRAEADGLAGPWTPIGEALALEIGPAGTLEVTTEDPVVVRFSGPAEVAPVRVGRAGASFALSPGAWRLEVSGGPVFDAATVDVVVTADVTTPVDLTPARRFDPGRAVLVAGWPTERDRGFRGDDRAAMLEAAAAGVGYVVLAPRDEVGGATDADDPGGVRWENGAWLTTPAWSILAWPWAANNRLAGHGASDLRGFGPEDALAAAAGGPATARWTAADLAWFDAVTAPPARVAPAPSLVILSDPGDHPGAAWAGWWRFLDAGVPVAPMGPYAWAPVADPQEFGRVEVEQALVEQRWSATTGPRLDLRVGRAGPGKISRSGDVRVVASPGLDRFFLIGQGGRTITTWTTTSVGHDETLPRPAGDWVVAVATGPGGAWAATAPVWLTARP